MGGWVVSATPRPLYPREKPGTHCIGGWVGLRAGLDRCGKIRPPPEFDPRTVHPVASRYTDRAIGVHTASNGKYIDIVYFLLGISPASNSSCPTFRNPVPKRRPTTIWRRGNTQKKIYNIQITAKVWNQENGYMFRSFTVLHCSHRHCVQHVASDVEVVGYL